MKKDMKMEKEVKAKAPVKKGAKKVNPWMAHVKKVRAKNKGMAYKDVLVKAKGTYKKKA